MARWKAKSPSFGPWIFTVRDDAGQIIAVLEHYKKKGSGNISCHGKTYEIREDNSEYLATKWLLGDQKNPLWTLTKVDSMKHHYTLEQGKIRLSLQKESAFGETYNVTAGATKALGQIKQGSSARRGILLAREIPEHTQLPLFFSLWLVTLVWRKNEVSKWTGMIAALALGLVTIFLKFCVR